MYMELYDPYLAHYGVKGMQWGVRKDRKGGLLRRKSNDQDAAQPKKRPATRISKRAHRKDPASSLTNKELKARNERLRLEREYKNLQDDKAFKRGKTVMGVVVAAAAAVTVSAVSEAARNYIRGRVTTGMDSTFKKGSAWAQEFIKNELKRARDT